MGKNTILPERQKSILENISTRFYISTEYDCPALAFRHKRIFSSSGSEIRPFSNKIIKVLSD